MTAPLTDAVLDEIEARANAATLGPWICERDDDENGEIYYAIHSNKAYGFITNINGDRAKANSAFITQARTDVPLLTAEVRRLHKKCEQYSISSHYNGEESATYRLECERLRSELSEARKEMRERAAMVARGYTGENARAIAYDISTLPLEPEGEKA